MMVPDENETTCRPVIANFGSTALMALAIVLNLYDGFTVFTFLNWFFALSMAALSIQKLQDAGGGSNVPPGFISLGGNLIMAGMGVWMLGLRFAS